MSVPRRRTPAKSAPMARTAAQTELRALLLKAIELQRKGADQAVHLELTSDRKYHAEHILKIARTASLPEVTVLVRASEIREKGLAFIKAGDNANGAKWLREARRMFSGAELSREARLSAESFQYPAEAYLQYSRGDYGEAAASLLQAIVLCHALRDDYQHEVEVRRIHLARNIVRVKTKAGGRKDALMMSSLLVGYIEGHAALWPLPELRMTSTPDPLLAEERWALMDQVLGEIALLTTRRNETSLDFLSGSASWPFNNDNNRAVGEFAQVYGWLAARRAMVEGDARGFLTHSVAFFNQGRGYLNRAWRELTLDLVDLCAEIAPEELASLHTS
jgi:hypothetical protein